VQSFESVIPKTSFNVNGQEYSSCLALQLGTIGEVFTKPASYLLTGFARVFLIELKPGWWGQKSSPIGELLYRTCLLVVGIVLCPFAILGAVFGTIMCAMASLSKKDFVYHRHLASNENRFKTPGLISFNTLLAPEFITRRNKHRPTMERVYEIGDALIRSKRITPIYSKEGRLCSDHHAVTAEIHL
jgi:hypothetical protein